MIKDTLFSTSSLQEEYIILKPLLEEILSKKTPEDILRSLKSFKTVKESTSFFAPRLPFLNTLSTPLQNIFYALIAINQGKIIFQTTDLSTIQPKDLEEFLASLLPVDSFYKELGGIVGYHCQFLKLLFEKEKNLAKEPTYLQPPKIDISKEDKSFFQNVRYGLESLPQMAEIYPVAGAADRLHLLDEVTKEPLPASELQFLGRSLLEWLIEDLEAKEFLYFKLYNKQITIPILLMTSYEKNNHSHIMRILEEKSWFSRPKTSFFFMIQPLVPMITKEGNWAVKSPMKLFMKPGGHGAIWKLAKESGAFQWFTEKKVKNGLIRQINNPIAGTDSDLLAFTGIGVHEQKEFGFASCERLVGSAEGMNVLIEEKNKNVYEYKITNLEYTDFEKKGIKDEKASPDSPFSCFPSNTNILYLNLKAIEQQIDKNPFPGLILNLKSQIETLNSFGKFYKIEAARLESTMQNIADEIITIKDHPLKPNEYQDLKTYLTFNQRSKTMAVTKRLWSEGTSIQDTPEGALYAILENNQELLKRAQFKIHKLAALEEFQKFPPSFLFTFHPSLGPLYSIIIQKLRKGVLEKSAYLNLDISEVDIEDLHLNGVLHIIANNQMGTTKDCRYSDKMGKCTLKNVKVDNAGLDFENLTNFWKFPLKENESLTIRIEEDGEFYAENVTFKGTNSFCVPAGNKMVVSEINGTLKITLIKISSPTWGWKYSFRQDSSIELKRLVF